MGRRKIDDNELQRLIAAGVSQAECARRFAVSETAIGLRLKRLKQLTSRVVALERAADVVDERMDSAERLRNVQRIVDEQLDWAVRQAREPGAPRAALIDTILRLAGEVRQQLSLQIAITNTLVDLRVVKEFQETVVAVIQSESPATAARVVARLKERRALRPHANLPTLAGSAGGHDVA